MPLTWSEMLTQVYEKLPSLYRWVEYCYSGPAHWFFGDCVLQSAASVQQDDPLGPLLFSLVSPKIEAEFPNLDYASVLRRRDNCWLR